MRTAGAIRSAAHASRAEPSRDPRAGAISHLSAPALLAGGAADGTLPLQPTGGSIWTLHVAALACPRPAGVDAGSTVGIFIIAACEVGV